MLCNIINMILPAEMFINCYSHTYKKAILIVGFTNCILWSFKVIFQELVKIELFGLILDPSWKKKIPSKLNWDGLCCDSKRWCKQQQKRFRFRFLIKLNGDVRVMTELLKFTAASWNLQEIPTIWWQEGRPPGKQRLLGTVTAVAGSWFQISGGHFIKRSVSVFHWQLL